MACSENMKIVTCIAALSLMLSPKLCLAHGGGGGGHGGGRHQGGGHGNGHGGGHHQGGHHGHWSHHHGGAHGRHGWYGNNWYGPYYYGGWWWGATGLFLVGLTFYTCSTAAIKNTNTWIIYNGDTTVYQSWPQDSDDLSIMQVENDPDGYNYRICNGDDSCVKAKPAPSD